MAKHYTEAFFCKCRPLLLVFFIAEELGFVKKTSYNFIHKSLIVINPRAGLTKGLYRVWFYFVC